MTIITQLPVPPSSEEPENFDQRADAFVAALPQFVTETNRVAMEVNANRLAAEAASDAEMWVQGSIYSKGVVVYSPSTYLSYRDSTGGLSNTDPAMDPRWVALNGQGQNLDDIEETLIEHDERLDALELEQITVFDEGVATVADAKEFNFVGEGVTVTQSAPGRARVSIPGTDLSGVNQTLVEHDQRLDMLEAEPDLSIRDEGMEITPAARSINFAGAGVTANTDPQGNVTVSIPGGGAGGNPLVVQDEGMQVEDDALTLNFTGAGVTATSVNGLVTVTIPGGGGGGSSTIAVDDEGLELTDMLTRLNFVGGGVMATETSPGVISVSIPGQMPITAADEGIQVEDDVRSLNFVGEGVTATSDPAGNLTVTVPGAPAPVPLVIQDEGIQVEDDALTLNFVGEGVTATSVDGVVTIDIPGGVGGGAFQFFDEIRSENIGPAGDFVEFATTLAVEQESLNIPEALVLALGKDAIANNGAFLVHAGGALSDTSRPAKRSVQITPDRTQINSGLDSVSIGSGSSSAGSSSVAIKGTSSGANSVAVSNGAVASGLETIALGLLATSVTTKAIAIGARAEALGQGVDGAIAIGAGAKTGNTSISAVSLGNLANARGQYAICVGHGSSVTDGADDSIAIGRGATIEENIDFSVTIGRLSACQASAVSSVTIGYIARSSAGSSTAVGRETNIATGATNSSVFGAMATIPANAQNSTALGYQATVAGSNQVQLGNSATTTYAYGAVQDRSDLRDKTEVRDTELGLDFVMSLRPVDFKWDYREDYYIIETIEFVDEETGETRQEQVKTPIEKDGSKARNRFHHGFVAQEIQKFIEETGKDFGGFKDGKIDGGADVLTVGYTEFIGPLVKAIQQQQAQIELLKAEINNLKGAA